MRISQLESVAARGGRVALWGWGREGQAAWRALRKRLPALPLTLFCSSAEAAEAQALGDPGLTVETGVDGERLAGYAVVIKSPGISPYGPEASLAAARGTRFIGGTALWFAEHPRARCVCVTGTKGKSTTSALLAHLLRAGGHRTALAGNIGLPLLELLEPDPEPEFWVIELSSYQTRDVAASGVRPEVAVLLNLYPEHLDWHGGEARYASDKLALLTDARPRTAVLEWDRPVPDGFDPEGTRLLRFNDPAGWHLRGDDLYRGERRILDTSALPLPGRHNRGNLCAALAAAEALGLDAAPLARHATGFRPLPNRLQDLGEREGIRYVNDSISTTPHASLAALACFRGQRVAILLGGHDRGVEWEGFARAIAQDPPAAVVTMGANGPRIHAALEAVAERTGFSLNAAVGLAEAVARARASVAGGGVVLLSPGAPSFGPYRDYVERGRHFTALAGFDPDAVSAIPGLGVSSPPDAG